MALGNFGVLLTFRFVYIFYLIVGGEVSVARIQFLSVSLANVSPFLETFYNIDLIHYSIIVICIKSIKSIKLKLAVT